MALQHRRHAGCLRGDLLGLDPKMLVPTVRILVKECVSLIENPLICVQS